MITIKGVHLKEAFEHSVAKYDIHDHPGAFLQMSGMHLVEYSVTFTEAFYTLSNSVDDGAMAHTVPFHHSFTGFQQTMGQSLGCTFKICCFVNLNQIFNVFL